VAEAERKNPQTEAQNLTLLAIETSCDETAVAIVRANGDICANEILSQFDDHKSYGGVVPEIAARAHISHLDGLVTKALSTAGLQLDDIDAIAATSGPGLIGGLMVGVLTAKAMAAATGKPYVAVNHLAGHALTPRLTDNIPFPYLLLLASGGHCQILVVKSAHDFQLLGTTIDDAAGEAFDKTAKLLGLGQPGGPAVEALAKAGDAQRFSLPRPLLGSDSCDLSFSGLKTAVRRTAEGLADARGAIARQDMADLAAGFQQAVTDCLVDRMSRAISRFHLSHGDIAGRHMVVAGGVAANQHLRTALTQLADTHKMIFAAPPLKLCTDNAAMIGWAALERLATEPGLLSGAGDQAVAARPRWPLDSTSESQRHIGGGKKGRKV